MMAICYIATQQLQKEVKSNPKHPTCKRGHCETQGGGQEMAVMVGYWKKF